MAEVELNDEVMAADGPGSDSPEPHITDLNRSLQHRQDLLVLAVIGLLVLALFYTLYLASTVILPIILAALLSLLLRPMVRMLKRFFIPEALGAAIVLVALAGLVVIGMTTLTEPATQWMASAPDSMRKMEFKVRQWLKPLARLNQAAQRVEKLTSDKEGERTRETAAGETEKTQKIEIRRGTLTDIVLGYTKSFIIGAVEMFVLLYFLLASGDLFLQKLVKVLPTLQDKKQAVEIAHEVQENISTFLFTITVINAVLGFLVGIGLYLVGMPNAILWGVMAALLNFIPYFGPIVGVTVLTFAGLLIFDSDGQAILPPLIYLGLHGLESNFITPMILGRRLTLNPVVIFVSLIFWSWLWGIPGALLAVPMLMIAKILCDHIKPLASFGEFLGR